MADQQLVRKIYAIGSALGIKGKGRDDDLHALVSSITGKDSIGRLSDRDAEKVIKELQRLQGNNAPPKKRKKQHNAVAGGMTESQQRKAWYLMYELEKLTPGGAELGDRLCGIIRKELKVDAAVKEPFAWLDFKAGNKLIEILKKYLASAERKCKRA